MRIYDPDTVDLHVYPFWEAGARPDRHLGPEKRRSWPRTLDLLVAHDPRRRVSAAAARSDIDETAFAFEKVAAAVIHL